MATQTNCLKCAEQYIAAAKEASDKGARRVNGVGNIDTGTRSWWCPDHGGFTVKVTLRRDR